MINDINKYNKILNFINDGCLIVYSILFFVNCSAVWIIMIFFIMLLSMILMAFTYREVYIRCFKYIQIDGFMKLLKLSYVTVVLPYASELSILYFYILICLMVIDILLRFKLYTKIFDDTYTSNYYINTITCDSKVIYSLLFSHVFLTIFIDSDSVVKLTMILCVFIYSIQKFKILYSKIHFNNNNLCFIKAVLIYYICLFITSFMIYYDNLNFLFYLISSLSVSGCWKKHYVNS